MNRSILLAALLLGCSDKPKSDSTSKTVDESQDAASEKAGSKAVATPAAIANGSGSDLKDLKAEIAKTNAGIKEIKTKLAVIEKEIKSVKSAPAKPAQQGASTEDEAVAQKMFADVQGFLKENKYDEAKALLKEMGSKYQATRTYRRASKLGKELEVFGKAAPTSNGTLEWLQGSDKDLNFSSGTTLLVFWEVWCPHCKREVPEVQARQDKYKAKGLNVVGLTKMSRNKSMEEVMGFIKEKDVSYPMVKEDGALSKHFNVSGIPAAAVVKDGKIVWRGHPARLSDEMIDGWLAN
jgi:thiol-disulfide isomerase/thioredoxin